MTFKVDPRTERVPVLKWLTEHLPQDIFLKLNSISFGFFVLKRHNQAKIINKSVLLFSFFNMAIRCEPDHSLELQRSFNFGAAVATWQVCRKQHLSVIPVFFYFGHASPKLYFVLISSITGKCSTQNLENVRDSSLWTCWHNMAISRGQNKNTVFLMISAWLCRFKYNIIISVSSRTKVTFMRFYCHVHMWYILQFRLKCFSRTTI